MSDGASRDELARRFAQGLGRHARGMSARVRWDLGRPGDLRVLWFAEDSACFKLIEHTAKHAPIRDVVWVFESDKEKALRLVGDLKPNVLFVSSGEVGGHEVLEAAKADSRCRGLQAVNTYWGDCELRPPFDHRLPTWGPWDGGFLDYMEEIRALFRQIRADLSSGTGGAA